jgi:hypothetical protein
LQRRQIEAQTAAAATSRSHVAKINQATDHLSQMIFGDRVALRDLGDRPATLARNSEVDESSECQIRMKREAHRPNSSLQAIGGDRDTGRARLFELFPLVQDRRHAAAACLEHRLTLTRQEACAR